MSDKILKLSQAQTLYQDLRERVDALPTSSDIPTVPVQDVQINNTSILNNGIANIPYATKEGAYGLVKININKGLTIAAGDGTLITNTASNSDIKAGSNMYKPIVPGSSHQATFYGLAKAAGDSTQSQSSNAVGTYTDEAKAAIQKMLGIADLIALEESHTATANYTKNTIFLMDGKLYKSTVAINIGDAIEEGTNCVATNISEAFAKTTDLTLKANVIDGVFIKSISLGRKENSTVGSNSVAFGDGSAIASGNCSFAQGRGTATGIFAFAESASIASGNYSHAEGNSTAAGAQAHAEGYQTQALEAWTHTEGIQTIARGRFSHTQGNNTIANGAGITVIGLYNIEDVLYSEWVANTSYNIGDKVTYSSMGFVCKVANNDAAFNSEKWESILHSGDTAFILGNGSSTTRSNAYALDWNGTAHYAGDVYVGCNNDSTGGTRLATITEVAAKLDAAEAGLKVVRLL